MNLPNIITVARIFFVPAFVIIYLLGYEWSYLTAATLFALAAATDWLDGYLARKLEQITPFGAFLDPVADKLIVVSAIVVLLASHSTIWLTLPALVIIGREIVISALREWMASMNASVATKVSSLGKIKTTIQMIGITLLLSLPPQADHPLLYAAYVVMYLAAVMTLWSMSVYLRAAWPTLKLGLRA